MPEKLLELGRIELSDRRRVQDRLPSERLGLPHCRRPRARPREAKLIVMAAFFLVAEHVVGFLHFLETRLGLLVARIAVRVILPGQLAVGPADLLLLGSLGNSQDFIIIARHVVLSFPLHHSL